MVMSLGGKGWMNSVVNAIQHGSTVIIEGLGENIDAVLDPLLSRAFYRKGRNWFIKIGGEEIDYDAKFQLLSDITQDMHDLHGRLNDKADELRRRKTEVFPLDEIFVQLLSSYDDKLEASHIEGLLRRDFPGKFNLDHPLARTLLTLGPLTRDSVSLFRNSTGTSTKTEVSSGEK